jgi:hypothetical protein
MFTTLVPLVFSPQFSYYYQVDSIALDTLNYLPPSQGYWQLITDLA